MYTEKDVVELVNNYYISRLKKWTGLDFYVETYDDTFYGGPVPQGGVKVFVSTDENGRLFTMSARSWDELYRVVDSSIAACHVMQLSKSWGALAFESFR